MKDGMTLLALRANKPQRLPIRYWQAIQGNTPIATNNSIAILRHQLQGVKGVVFKAVR